MPQTSTEQKPNQPRNWLKWAIPLAILVAVVAAYILLVWWPAYIQPAKYSYSRLDNYSLSWMVKGYRTSFSKPVELSLQTAGANQLELSHIVKKRTASHIAAAVVTAERALSKEELLVLGSNLTRSDSQYHGSTVAPLKKFAADRLPPKWVIKSSAPKNFNSATIKKDAWALDITATSSVSKKTPFKGRAVLAISANRYYYFMIVAPEYNWQANQKIWQQVLGSLQIDQ